MTGNVGKAGTGANIFRGHDNVQGATDVGLDIVTLPFYYGLAEGAWKHWARVWEVDYDFLKSRFDSKQIMETPGIPLTRWFEAVTLPKDQVAQKDNVRAVFVQGHASNSITRIPESLNGLKALELLVIADPHPTTWASLAVEAGRKDDVYILPVATQFECKGSRVASNRSLQWGEQIVKPVFESKDDLEVIYLMAKKFGFADKMFKNIKVESNLPVAEDVLREMNRGSWSTGYCGQSPERLKAHMKNQAKFDMLTMRAPKDDPEVGGDYYGLPWPCWGSPEVKHPGTPLLYNTNLSVMDGGGTFRPRFGIEREEKLPDGTARKVSLLADGSYSKDSEIQDGYPEFTLASLKKLGWDKDLTEAEMATITRVNSANPDAVSWSLDLSGGIQRVALMHGCVCRIRFRFTASRSTRRGSIWSRNIRRCPTPSSSACPISASPCRRPLWRRGSPSNSPSSSPRGVLSNTRAAARRREPIHGSQNCSRTCSSRSARPMPPIAASRTAAGSG